RLFSIVLAALWLLAMPCYLAVSALQVVMAEQNDTAPFVYTDTESGVTFTVPANWSRKAFTEDREYLDVKFVSSKEAGTIILYGSVDAWAEMPAVDRIGYTRSDLSNSAFTREDIAQTYGTSADKITMVTYNGIEYFRHEIANTMQILGVEVTAKTTFLIHYRNGWLYSFQLSTPGTDTLYADFESLMNSVRYPADVEEDDVSDDDTAHNGGVISTRPTSITRPTSTTRPASTTHASNTTTEENANDTPYDTADVVTMIAMGVFAVCVVILIVLFCTKTKPPAAPAPTEETTATREERVIYCSQCGGALPSDSKFCSMCGVKLHRADDAQNDS
ncbi:MAG: hypothetical protein IJC52_03255, partial [Clostridia bacterium]|nr:hypothetical protein [Clostridia bacterium]